ncbi:MAG: GspH/FimT family pseudopilin [Candidatus Eisenbacteria bacterium]
MGTRGMTLVELMVGLVIFGILVAVSLPAFRKYMSTQQVEGAANRMSGNLRLARQRAATEGNSYRITFDAAAQTYAILDDDNNNGLTDTGETVLGPINIPAELTVTNGPLVPFPGDTLVFYPNGRANVTGSLTLANSKGHSRMVFVVQSTGAVAVR